MPLLLKALIMSWPNKFIVEYEKWMSPFVNLNYDLFSFDYSIMYILVIKNMWILVWEIIE